jgi:[ribosomal protein S5]-alanine N-acetyltransferase
VNISRLAEPVIHCERLELHHVSGFELLKLADDPASDAIYEGHDYVNPHRVLVDGPSPVAWRAPQVRDDPSTNKWFIRWMVLRQSREIVGSLSFHGPPDDRGMLEIGLGVHEAFRRRGYGREALLGMWGWASRQPGVAVFRYTVSPENVASVGLVTNLGFGLVGRQIDEIDGPEDIYEMSIADFTMKWSG